MKNPYAITFSSTHEFEYSIRDYVREQLTRLHVATGDTSYYNTIRLDSSKEKAEWYVMAGSTHGDTVSVTMEVLEKAVDAVITMYNAKQGGKLSLLTAPVYDTTIATQEPPAPPPEGEEAISF